VSATLTVLSALAPVGLFDVGYYHLYRFRLFERTASRAEELTHLVRQATFVAIAVVLAGGVRTPVEDRTLLALFALDFTTSLVDVMLEPSSRKALGGLPPGEYVLHFLGTFGMGIAAATYLFERRELPLVAAPWWQTAPLIVGGLAILLVELGLVLRARLGGSLLGVRCCGPTRQRA
jgi:hypothetical protein